MIKYICDSCRKEVKPEFLKKIKLDNYTEVEMCDKCRGRLMRMIETGAWAREMVDEEAAKQ